MNDNKPDFYVVTGGAGGMGSVMAQHLGKLGTILLTDVAPDALEETADKLRSEGIKVQPQVTDISDRESVGSLANTASSMGRLAGIAHTAGISPLMANWKRIFEVDLIGTALLLDAFLPLAGPGTVAVCWASMAGHMGGKEPDITSILFDPLAPDFLDRIRPYCGEEETASGGAYGLAKRGVIILCEKLAPAWGERGARIVSLSPGIIDTAMARLEMEKQPAMASMIEMSPIKRMGKPEDLAAAAEFLLSDQAAFITGTDLLVDGGVVAAINNMAQQANPRHSKS